MITAMILVILFTLAIVFMFIYSMKKSSNSNKIMIILSIIYLIFSFISIVLPDGLIVSTDDYSLLTGYNKVYLVIRIFRAIMPVVLFISCYYKNKYFLLISKFVLLPISILLICYYNQYISFATMERGRGLNYIFFLPESFKEFLISSSFRTIWYSIDISLGLSIIIALYISTKLTKVKIKEINISFVILICLLFQFLPIYIPQLLFEGFSDVIFDSYSVVHISWLVYIASKIIVLYFLFKKKDDTTKYILLLVLSFSALFQYNSMFSLTINILRLPLQLCNIASYLLIIALFNKSKKLFNFLLLVNAMGATIALFFPDLNNVGIFEVWNMHFMYEHTNIVIVPILCYSFGIIECINRKALKDAVVGFGLYFVIILILGIVFNGIASILNDTYYNVNYFFMFDVEKAFNMLPFLRFTQDFPLCILSNNIYPLLIIIVFIGFNCLIVLFYLPFFIHSKKRLNKQ